MKEKFEKELIYKLDIDKNNFYTIETFDQHNIIVYKNVYRTSKSKKKVKKWFKEEYGFYPTVEGALLKLKRVRKKDMLFMGKLMDIVDEEVRKELEEMMCNGN